jgi:hypothetical protein
MVTDDCAKAEVAANAAIAMRVIDVSKVLEGVERMQ